LAAGPFFEKTEETSMTEPKRPESDRQKLEKPPAETQKKGSTRRAFLSQVSGAAAATLAASAIVSSPPAAAAPQEAFAFDSGSDPRGRAQKCFSVRVNAAQAELNARAADEITNGDDHRFPNRIRNFSKGLVHDEG
jgi:hypothetical protein